MRAGGGRPRAGGVVKRRQISRCDNPAWSMVILFLIPSGAGTSSFFRGPNHPMSTPPPAVTGWAGSVARMLGWPIALTRDGGKAQPAGRSCSQITFRCCLTSLWGRGQRRRCRQPTSGDPSWRAGPGDELATEAVGSWVLATGSARRPVIRGWFPGVGGRDPELRRSGWPAWFVRWWFWQRGGLGLLAGRGWWGFVRWWGIP